MTLAVAPTSTHRRKARSGWRPRGSGDFPTLGWHVLNWTYRHLPSPSSEHQPFIYTGEQARRILRIYELDPETGRRVHDRRVHEEEAKGWGKSPFAASIAMAEFRGPVLFDGWDDDGQPSARRWGHGGSPQPWIQVAGVSEAATRNTWGSIYYFVTANEKRAAKELGIEDGRTLLYLRDMPSALMERVTQSAGSREGQPLTHSVIDEPQQLTEANGGDQLTRTILRNLTKTGGWAHFTGNAPLIGAGSVAETFGLSKDGVADEGTLHFATRPSEKPQEDWPRERKLWALGQVYRDVPWVLDHLDRVLVDADDPKIPWTERLRFSFNWRDRTTRAGAWMDPEVWAACAGDPVFDPTRPVFAVVRVAHGHRIGAVALAQRRGEDVLLRVRHFRAEPDEHLVVQQLEDHLRALHRRYPAVVDAVVRFGPDSPERHRSLPGPEVLYHGSFFEGSAQRLRRDGLVMVDVPSTAARVTPASEALMQMVATGHLVHDGDPVLASQVDDVVARPVPQGYAIDAAEAVDGSPLPIVAAVASMLAVHRAISAPIPRDRSIRRGRPS